MPVFQPLQEHHIRWSRGDNRLRIRGCDSIEAGAKLAAFEVKTGYFTASNLNFQNPGEWQSLNLVLTGLPLAFGRWNSVSVLQLEWLRLQLLRKCHEQGCGRCTMSFQGAQRATPTERLLN